MNTDGPADDRQRRDALLDQLKQFDGLTKERYQRIRRELADANTGRGYDEHGRARIAFFDAKSYEIDAFDRRNDDRFALHYIPTILGPDTAAAADGYSIACVFVNDEVSAPVVKRLADVGVQMLALRCAGYNNVDLDACRHHKMSVARVPDYSPHAVAEHTVALMLMLNRHLHLAYTRNRTGLFVLDGLTGFDMRGRTAGVVGTGRIGQCLVEILLGFGCRLLAYDKFPNDALRERPGVQYVELDQLLAESDLISLHVPLFEETHHLIDAAAIDRMKPGAMLINTSRGGLVDTRALIQGLKSGKIGAAGLDVYEEEAGIFFQDMSNRVLTDDVLARLLTFNNVVITSHQAFLTHEALTNIADTTFDNIAEFVEGKRGGDLTNSCL